ncbi:MAG: type II toxin-antitoxin system RelE/ParE family toxin [Bacteroidota bacterium]
MDTKKLPVIVSEKFQEDQKNIFKYGFTTFGETAAIQFYENLEKIIHDLGNEYYMYPECRFLPSKLRIYRNIILESYLIIYRITTNRIEVLRAFHSSICTTNKIRMTRKIKF